jgi:putative alpha-1,2-mannosidase
VAVLLLASFVLQGPVSVLAGTTGAVNGTVVDAQSNKPIAGAVVTAQSPSQSARTTSDAAGRFSFISLAPDTYAISVPATAAYDAATVSGVTVQADQTLTVTLQQPTKLKVIGSVTSRAASALVKPGTTADVYSINAVTQDKTSVAGGGFDSRRRLQPDRLRARRYPRQPRVRQLPVRFGVVAGAAGAASLHRRDARKC